MKNKQFLFLFSLALLLNVHCLAQKAQIPESAFNALVGSWEGNLTYLDYSSGQPYSMPANVVITKLNISNGYLFSNQYPDEPKANSQDTVLISSDGKQINTEEVVSFTKQKEGNWEIYTEYTAADGNDNKPARIQHQYTLSAGTFAIQKKVKFEGSDTWILRHTYSYHKK